MGFGERDVCGVYMKEMEKREKGEEGKEKR